MMEYKFKGFHGCDSKCDIEIIRRGDGKIVVIATELDDNPGTSITNIVETLATEICQAHDIKHFDLIWIEHYPERGRYSRLPESWDLVTFNMLTGQGLSDPRWNRLDVSELQRIRGYDEPIDIKCCECGKSLREGLTKQELLEQGKVIARLGIPDKAWCKDCAARRNSPSQSIDN